MTSGAGGQPGSDRRRREVGGDHPKTTTVWLLVATMLALGCARSDWIDRTLVTENVTGVWFGTEGGPSPRELFLELQQQGARVTGIMRMLGTTNPGPYSGPIGGSVAGDTLTLKDPRGEYQIETTVEGETMTGRMVGPLGVRFISLRRTSPSTQPSSPPR